MSGNRIKFIPGGLLQKTPGLTHLELKGNPLVAVEHQAFTSLPRLRKLQVLLYFYLLSSFSISSYSLRKIKKQHD